MSDPLQDFQAAILAALGYAPEVIEPGRMIDIEATNGVLVRNFRSTSRLRAALEVANRVRGIFRPRALA